ncbi:MAG: GTPase ObgE [Candidatus Omnitrophota bacterium]
MAFIDEARIFVKAGDGGKGCESFYSDKLTRHPRPDGGDGGNGGDIVFVADRRIQTLLDFKFRQHYKGERGGHASSKGKSGRTGEDCILKVPVGTILRDDESKLVLKDLLFDGQRVNVAKGGRGGLGNGRHKRTALPTEGESKVVYLELKLIADVGLIGFPNAGKSSLISAISSVRPKIACYPFTTKQPVLGIVKGEESDFIVADMPGLIEGAHEGRGLGDRFLKHIERTTLLVHVIDMAATEGRDPFEDYQKINHELYEYKHLLIRKQKILVANKMDLDQSKDNLKKFREKCKEPILAISALEKTGCDRLVEEITEALCRENFREKSSV